MFRMWFMTFTGKPRDAHVFEQAHESPRVMTVPLIVLAFFSIVLAWGWPLYDAEASLLGHELHHAQPHSIIAEFGFLEEHDDWAGGAIKAVDQSERVYGFLYHSYAEALAFVAGGLGLLFAALLYYYRRLDPAEAKEQFPALHRFLCNKWYFDELYSAILVQPALVVARWCRNVDIWGIDGLVDTSARATVRVSKWSGRFDLGIVDGLVNLTADVIYAVGARLRRVQTGYLRSYVLFLVLAAIGIFALLSYVLVTLARAG
jgi:NADH-quinone oxidoreductase subunit L